MPDGVEFRKLHTMSRNLSQSDARFHEALARIIKEEAEFPRGTLVTLVDTHMTPDSKHVTGTLSVLPAGNEAEALRSLRTAEHDIKDVLGAELRMRRIPSLHWRFDHTEAEAAVIEEALNELKKRGEL